MTIILSPYVAPADETIKCADVDSSCDIADLFIDTEGAADNRPDMIGGKVAGHARQ